MSIFKNIQISAFALLPLDSKMTFWSKEKKLFFYALEFSPKKITD